MTTIIHSYNVVDKAGFSNKLKDLTKRFKVVSSLSWGTPFSEVVEVRRDEFYDVTYFPVTVEFSFDTFKIEGYDYVGCIKDGDMIGFITIHGVNVVGGVDLTEWIKSFQTIPCHACNRKHSRKIGHIFHKVETNEFLVFGSSCAKKYFGINFDRILSFFEGFSTKIEEWDADSRGRHFASIIDTTKLLSEVYFIISKYGYTSVSAAMGDDTVSPTSLVLEGFRNDPSFGKYKYIGDLEKIAQDVDFSTVWETPIVTKNPEMNHNIEVIQRKMSQNLLSEKDFGWVSFMVWDRFFKPAPAQTIVYTHPEGVTVGDKLQNVPATFLGFVSYEGRWGVGFINMFESDNVRYKWFSSVNIAGRINIDKGDCILIKKATVKGLEDDVKFGKSVIITRASVEVKSE
jgi:hypothetical protein